MKTNSKYWLDLLLRSGKEKTLEEEKDLLDPPTEFASFKNEDRKLREEVLKNLLEDVDDSDDKIKVLMYLSHWDREPEIRKRCLEAIDNLHRKNKLRFHRYFTSVLASSGTRDACGDVRDFAISVLNKAIVKPIMQTPKVRSVIAKGSLKTRRKSKPPFGAKEFTGKTEEIFDQEGVEQKEIRMILDRIANSAPDRRLRLIAGRNPQG